MNHFINLQIQQQNENSQCSRPVFSIAINFALKNIMEVNTCIKQIEQKFCTPGHSAIQEVDNIHSHIEKIL